MFPVTCERMGFPASEIRELVSTKAAGEAKGAEERSQNRSSPRGEKGAAVAGVDSSSKAICDAVGLRACSSWQA